jgi:hypothetical protein
VCTGGGIKSLSFAGHHCVSEVPVTRLEVLVRREIQFASSRRLWRILLAFQRLLVSRRTVFCCCP